MPVFRVRQQHARLPRQRIRDSTASLHLRLPRGSNWLSSSRASGNSR